MLLDLRRLRGPEELLVERVYRPAAFAAGDGDDDVVADAVVVTLRVRKDGDTYRLRGHIDTTMRLACGRCLEPFDMPTKIEVDLRYLPQRVNTGEGEHEIAEDDLSTAFYRDDQIDLGHLVGEQLQLAAPMKPLCRESCRGLCPMCGTNLNSDACSCETGWRDPRLDALRSMLPDSAEAGQTRKD